MGKVPKSALNDLCQSCSRLNVKEMKKVSAEEFEEEIKKLQSEKHDGPIRLTFRDEEGESSSEYLFFDKGTPIMVMVERGITKENPELEFVKDIGYYEGVVELFAPSAGQLDQSKKLIQSFETEGPKGAPAAAETKEKPAEGKKETEAEAKEEKEETPPDREELLKKLKISEPGEEFAEKVVDEYKEKPLTKGECKVVFGKIKSDLGVIVGEKKAENLLEKHMKKLDLDKSRLTCEDVEKTVESIKKKVLVNIVGPKKADKTIGKFKNYIKEIRE